MFTSLGRRMESVVQVASQNLARHAPEAQTKSPIANFDEFTRVRRQAIIAFARLNSKERSTELYAVAQPGELPYWEELREILNSPSATDFLKELVAKLIFETPDANAYADRYLSNDYEQSERVYFRIRKNLTSAEQGKIPFLTVTVQVDKLADQIDQSLGPSKPQNTRHVHVNRFYRLEGGELRLEGGELRLEGGELRLECSELTIDLDRQTTQTRRHPTLYINFDGDHVTQIHLASGERINDPEAMLRLLRERLEYRMAELTLNRQSVPAWQNYAIGNHLEFSLGRLILGSILESAVQQQGTLSGVNLEWLPKSFR